MKLEFKASDFEGLREKGVSNGGMAAHIANERLREMLDAATVIYARKVPHGYVSLSGTLSKPEHTHRIRVVEIEELK
jgi:hypothetical protein